VLKRGTKRPRLRYSDRLFWVTLRRLWPNWRKPILIVKPDTVVRWHRKGFRLYWRFRSRSKLVARPITALDVRTAIQTMARENPWGAPRIHGELLSSDLRSPSEPSRDTFHGRIETTRRLNCGEPF